MARRIMFATGDPDKFPYGISPEILEQIFSYIDNKKDNARLGTNMARFDFGL